MLIPFSIFILISFITTFFYSLGLLFFLINHDDNRCQMTHMFEYPQFVRISQRSVDDKYPKYGLYAYGEGHLTKIIRDMYFDGIPVLFLPGNSGSYKQVRSLASVALRKAINSRMNYHFDYFAIDFNEELTGLNGALLQEQLNYATHSMYTIFNLYKNRNNSPKSIILIGHSMGGVIARNLANLSPNLVNIIITMSSPHKRPPLMLDSYFKKFYKDFESNATFISLSGGHNDIQVPFILSDFDDNALNIVTTHIPKAWVSVDHLCILWCKQIVLAVNRALFESIDPKTGQISTDPDYRQEIFRHHLIHHNGIKSSELDNYLGETHINDLGEWNEYLARQYSIILNKGTREPKWYMVQLLKHSQHQYLTILAISLETRNWIYVCGAHIPKGTSRVCEKANHLSHLSEIVPSIQYKRRTINLNMHEILDKNPDFTHIIFNVAPTKDPVNFHVDIYNENDRTIVIKALPNWWQTDKVILINETVEKAIHYKIILQPLQRITQAFYLNVEPKNCQYVNHHATVSLIAPWGYQNQHSFITNTKSKPIFLRLYKTKNGNESAFIKFILDPNCRYKISIQPFLIGHLNNIGLYYTILLVSNICAIILMTLREQLRNIDKNNQCSLFFNAVKDGAKPYYILTFAKLLTKLLSFNIFETIQPDWVILINDGMDFIIPLFMYMVSVAFVWTIGIILCISMTIFETTVQKVSLKFLAKTVSFTMSWSDYLMSALHKLPFIVAGTLICLSFTCGCVSLCLGLVFYFLKLTQLSQDYIEEVIWCIIRSIKRKLKKKEKNDNDPPLINQINNLPKQNGIFFHVTIFLIWCLVTSINLPSILTWAHNFKYSTVLKPDPSFLPGLVLSICALPLWQMELPKMERKWYKELGDVLMIFSIFILTYASISIYRLNYVLVLVVVLITLQQLFGPNTNIVEVENIEQPVEEKYEQVKAKLE